MRAISSGPTGVWAIEGAVLVQIDSLTGRVRRQLRVPRSATALAVVRGAAFLLDGDGALRRVDGRSGRISSPMGLNSAAGALGAGFGALWTLGRSRVIRVDEAGARLGVRGAPWCRASRLRPKR